MHLNGKNIKIAFEGENCMKMSKWTEYLYSYTPGNKCTPGEGLLPHRGNIHVNYHNIKRSSLIPSGQSKPNFVWSILRKGE